MRSPGDRQPDVGRCGPTNRAVGPQPGRVDRQSAPHSSPGVRAAAVRCRQPPHPPVRLGAGPGHGWHCATRRSVARHGSGCYRRHQKTLRSVSTHWRQQMMRFSRRLLAAGLRAHPANQDPNRRTDHPDQTSARHPTRRWWARSAVAATAIAMLATAGPALAAGDPASAAPATTGHVYWSTVDFSGLAGTIGRANLNGALANQNFIPGATQPFASPEVAVDAAHVYWTNERAGTIARANLDGTGVEQSFITGVSDTGGATVTVPKNGGPGTSNSPALRVAVDAAHVYWTNSATGTIGRANLDGTHVNRKFITGVGSPLGVAVDAAHVYWADNLAQTIGRANLDGRAVNLNFIAGASQPLGVAVDHTPTP